MNKSVLQRQGGLWLLLLLTAVIMLFPIWMLLSGSLMGEFELTDNLGPVLEQGREGYAIWPPIARYPTMEAYVELLFDTPRFLLMFWNSCIQVIPSVVGQLLVGAPAAWAFARFRFPGKRGMFLLYIILMLLPFQVTMVSNYLVLNSLGMMNQPLAVILPAVFSTFPVFLMVKFFASIPQAVMDAAVIDGASVLRLFVQIGLPMGAPGVISAVMLGFLESWNAIEQPMIFLMENRQFWPLSLYLPEITAQDAGSALAASVLMLLPALLLFLFGQEYLEQGICAAALKE